MITDISLAHRRTLHQIHMRDFLRLAAGDVKSRIDHPNLRTVSMTDDNLMPLSDETDQRGTSLPDFFPLFGRIVSQRIASQRNYDP